MAKRQFRSETVTPQSTNRFIIPKTFDPMTDSNVSTGATSSPAEVQPVIPATSIASERGGRPDKGTPNAAPSSPKTNNTGLSSDVSTGDIGALAGTVASLATGITGLGIIGAGTGAAVGVSQAESDLESIGIDSDLSTLSAFGAALTGGLVGESAIGQARKARATGIANVAKSAEIQGARTRSDISAVAQAAQAERTRSKSKADKEATMAARTRARTRAASLKAKQTSGGNKGNTGGGKPGGPGTGAGAGGGHHP